MRSIRRAIAALALAVVPSVVLADVATGLQWLSAQQTSDGSYRSAGDIATPYQATSEAIRTLRALGQGGQTASALSFINSETHAGTEYLTRKINANLEAGIPAPGLLSTLIGYQNTDGGFGELAGFQSNAADTALALHALAAMGQSRAQPASRALAFLLALQRPDGSWPGVEEQSSVVVSSAVLQAIWLLRQSYDLSTSISQSQQYLLSQRSGSALWVDLFESASALSALVPTVVNREALAESVEALALQQSSNGSFAGDVLTTALALRALTASTQPSADETLLLGRVLDGDTRQALGGVLLTLQGPTQTTATTGADGRFEFRLLSTGQYTLTVSRSGYSTTVAINDLAAGSQTNLGDLLLAKDRQNSTTGTIRGTVTAIEGGAPIQGATVSVDGGPTSTSSATGTYLIADVPAGAVVLRAAAPGYQTVGAGAAMPAGGTIIFSPKLPVGDSAADGVSVQGTITDSISGAPISGATVEVTGPSTVQVETAANGSYRLDGLAPGEYQLQATAVGYQRVTATASGIERTTIVFSPSLTPSNEGVPANTPATVRGVVVDSVTNAPIGNVSIAVQNASSSFNVTANGDGAFLIEELTGTSALLQFSASGYENSIYDVPLAPGAIVDLIQIRLRPQGLQKFLPDLVAEGALVTSAVVEDPQTFSLSGQVSITVANIGTAPASNYQVVAFRDENNDGRFRASDDILLGSSTLDTQLSPGGQIPVSIQVSGVSRFRDEPILVEIDDRQAVVESDEGNNLTGSMLQCRVEPEPLPVTTVQPVQKWRWSGQLVTSVPLVAPLRDTNGDGRYDENDDPVIVILSHDQFVDGDDAILRALDGKTGEQIWAVTDPNLRADAPSTPSIGDLDGDGIPEIVYYLYLDRGVAAINANGTLKWTSPGFQTTNTFYNYGSLSIADLDADGSPEVIARRVVLNSNGTIKWSKANDFFHLFDSVAADIDHDGLQEVVLGGEVYRHDGTPYGQGFGLVSGNASFANFDDDEFPEIVVANYGTIRLLDHNGQQLWSQPTPGGRGSSALIADVNGDGVPEIGIAGASRYTVFRADGSVLWMRVIVDPSGATGSTAFDFNADGKVEIVFHDQQELFVFNGETGASIYEVEHRSTTGAEQPIVADIDSDGHAEIIVVSDLSPTIGVRVFENIDDSWVPTRSIWNQHKYHITNINDDTSIPRVPERSWQRNNNFRVNAFLDRNPLDSADLTVGFLRIVDGGAGQPVVLSARIGNAGLIPSKATAMTRFYDGDPMAGGTLLGEVPIGSVAPGRYIDVELTALSELSGANDIWVVADAANVESECDEGNNTHHVPFRAAQALGEITVATDATSYGPNAPAVLSADASNVGSLANAYTIELIVEDLEGAVVVRFGPEAVGTLTPGQSAELDRVWSTLNTRTGSYVLRGILRRDDGMLVDEATTAFSIVTAAGVTASLRVTTDKPVYHTTDRVRIDSLARNLATNQAISNPQIQIRVTAPGGSEVYTQTLSITELSPGGSAARQLDQPLLNAVEGTYSISGTLLDANGAILATASASYQVQENTQRALIGSVSVDRSTVFRGEPVQCTDTITNRGTLNLQGQTIRQSVARLDQDAEVMQSDSALDLSAGGTQTLQRTVDTGGLALGDYACVLEAQINGSFVPLGNAVFKVEKPPIEIDSDLSIGPRGRLLVLMDPPEAKGPSSTLCHNGQLHLGLEADFDPPLEPDAIVQVKLLNRLGLVVDVESVRLAEFDSVIGVDQGNGNPLDLAIPTLSADQLVFTLTGQTPQTLLGSQYQIVTDIQQATGAIRLRTGLIDLTCNAAMAVGDVVSDVFTVVGLGADRHNTGQGIGDGPDRHNAAQQRQYLEQLLDSEGWTYTIHTDPAAFAEDLRAGGFVAYLLLSEYRVLDEPSQKLLREAVYRGDGLLVAGRHDVRTRILDAVLGLKYKGHHQSPQAVEILPNATITPPGTAPLQEGDRVQRAHLKTAVRLGRVRPGSTHDSVVTQQPFGEGRAVSAGFDLLAEAELAGLSSLMADVLRQPLSVIHPDQATARAGRVVPLRLTLQNRSDAVTGTATITPSLGSFVVQASEGEIVSGGAVEWTFDLAENETETLDLWVSLPPGGIAATIGAKVEAVDGSVVYDEGTITIDLNPLPAPSLDDAIAQLDAYVATQPQAGLLTQVLGAVLNTRTPARRALEHLKLADEALINGNPDIALDEILWASDELLRDPAPAIQMIRKTVAGVATDTARLQ